LILPTKPPHFDIWPQVRFSEAENPDGSFIVKFDHLNPKEYVTLSIFQLGSEPVGIANVRWRGGVGKRRPMGPQQIFPMWWIVIARILVAVGLFSIIYFLSRVAFNA
jgi:hypothetical protein